jgi:hypothetical protein
MDDAFYGEMRQKFKKLVEDHNLLEEEIIISGRTLSVEEAIGNPERRDYPIVKGQEKLMQAEFKGIKGQAFTDMPASFNGDLKEVLDRPLNNNFDRAVLVSTMNAVCRYLGLIDKTVHCHDEAPEICSRNLVTYISEKYGIPKVAMIGLQPAMLERLAEKFPIRCVDMDPDNIGKSKSGVEIEGMAATDEVLEWCDLIVATGSTVVNATIVNYCNKKPAIFFGTSGAAACYLMGLQRFCTEAS